MVSDFTTNNNPRYLYLAALQHPFPAWALSKPVPEAAAFSKAASTAFADPKRRLLPINTKEASFYSAINFLACVEDYPEGTFDRIKEACDFYGIGNDVAPYADMFADEHEKSAAVSTPEVGRFAINEQINGKEFKLLPLNDADDIRISAAELQKMASERRIHFLHLVPAARNIVKAAADIGGVKLPERIEMLGLERFTDFEKSAELIIGRAGDNTELTAHYEEAIAAMADGSITPDACMQKIAAIDEHAGVVYNFKKWNTIPSPQDVVFCGSLVVEAEKSAAENVYIRDILIPLNEFKKINPLDISFKLSKSAGDALSKVIDTDDAKDISIVVGAWPEDDQKTLLRMAAGQ